MIDFRYHLVSIISIFLALAVGIVLGAGPLKGSIGDTLTTELANVREDKAQLNDQLTVAKRLQTASNAFAGSVLGPVVAGRLDGESVLLVVGPQAGTGAVKAATDAVQQAGGSIATTVTFTADLLDTDSAAPRTKALTALAEQTDVSSADTKTLAGELLGRALVRGGDGVKPVTKAVADETLAGLVAAGLVKTVQPAVAPNERPTLVVVVPGAVPAEPAAEASARIEALLALARGLATQSAGTALVATHADAGTPGSSSTIVSAARRSDDTAALVTTVDDVDLPMGEVALALALAAEPEAQAGRYGVLDDAQAVIPAIPAPTSTPAPSSPATR